MNMAKSQRVVPREGKIINRSKNHRQQELRSWDLGKMPQNIVVMVGFKFTMDRKTGNRQQQKAYDAAKPGKPSGRLTYLGFAYIVHASSCGKANILRDHFLLGSRSNAER